MTQIETTVEHLDLDEPYEGDGEPDVDVTVWLTDADNTQRTSHVLLPGDPDDGQIAEALIDAVRGLAASRGPGLAAAVERRLR